MNFIKFAIVAILLAVVLSATARVVNAVNVLAGKADARAEEIYSIDN